MINAVRIQVKDDRGDRGDGEQLRGEGGRKRGISPRRRAGGRLDRIRVYMYMYVRTYTHLSDLGSAQPTMADAVGTDPL